MPIDALNHTGPFVASVHDHARQLVAEIAQNVLKKMKSDSETEPAPKAAQYVYNASTGTR
jgi:hypothetical protein